MSFVNPTKEEPKPLPLKILHALKPKNLSSWDVWPLPPSKLAREAYDAARFFHRASRIQVISTIEVVGETPQDQRPEYHVSLSRVDMRTGEISRISSEDAKDILTMFGVLGFAEDNHVPHGLVRNFWRPIADPMVGEVCRCVEDEPEIREDKGDFTWRGITK